MFQVNVDLDVLQILEIDDVKFTVSFSMYFGVRWLEPRIEGPPPPADNPYVPIDIKFINELWVPDVYVYFLKQINVLTIFTKFAGNIQNFQQLKGRVELGKWVIHRKESRVKQFI